MSLQYPLLTATLGLFGGICLAGVGLSGWQLWEYTQNKNNLEAVISDRKEILEPEEGNSELIQEFIKNGISDKEAKERAKIAPTEENLDRAKKNYENIVAREQELYEILKGNKTTTESTKKAKFFTEEDNQQPADLVNKLRESANRLNAQFKGGRVRIFRTPGTTRASDFGFGFRRYVSVTDGTTPRSRLKDIALEKDLIEYLVNNLVRAQREEGSPLILQSVMREPVEIARERGSSSTNIDEYFPTQAEVVRGKGIVDSYYFRFTFTTRTGLVRRWINNMEADGYPLFLRGVAVASAKPEVLAPEEAASGGTTPEGVVSPAPAALSDAQTPLPLVGLAGFGDTAQPPSPLPATPNTASAVSPAGFSASTTPRQSANKDAQIVLEAVPSEFTVSFEYVLPAQPASETAGKTSNN